MKEKDAKRVTYVGASLDVDLLDLAGLDVAAEGSVCTLAATEISKQVSNHPTTSIEH